VYLPAPELTVRGTKVRDVRIGKTLVDCYAGAARSVKQLVMLHEGIQ
jgi:hypothetical protein